MTTSEARKKEPATPQGLWWVKVDDHVYGPYTGDAMLDYIQEGRIVAESIVRHENGLLWRRADEEPELVQHFPGAEEAAETVAPPEKTEPEKKQKPDPAAATYVIVADIRARTNADFQDAIFNMGPTYQLVSNVWLLYTSHSANKIRNHLIQFLGKTDRLFVMDTTHHKTAWFNFGPEVDVKIRRVLGLETH